MTAIDPDSDDAAAPVATGAAATAPVVQVAPVAVFLTGNLFRHVAVMSLTSSLGIMAIFAVDVLNMVFISWLGHAELRRTSTRRALTSTSAATLIRRSRHVAG